MSKVEYEHEIHKNEHDQNTAIWKGGKHINWSTHVWMDRKSNVIVKNLTEKNIKPNTFKYIYI